jgi:hypothetical protein
MFLGTGTFTATVDCHTDATSTVSFHAEGVAAGPYPGTFVEDGTATIERPGLGRPSFTGGRLLSFEATFTIYAADGSLVTGQKQLNPTTSEAFTALGSEGNCIGDQQQHLVDIRAHTFYTATVQLTDGSSFVDQGTSPVMAQEYTLGAVPDARSFDESFVSTGILPPPPPPPSTPGKVTGGGQAPGLTLGGTISFGLVAESSGSVMTGHCNVVDHGTGQHVRCLTVDSFVQAATHATFAGAADVDGVPTRYRIDVDDLCESGAGCDTFKIQTDSGYVAGGVLTAGNVQIHPGAGP